MKKVLVFGANGFVGPYLAKEFYNNNYEVFGCDILDVSNNQYIFKYFKIDILNKKDVYDVIKKVEPCYIVNLAAISSVGLSWSIPGKTMEINTIGAINIFEAVKELNTNIKILIIGSSEEYISLDRPLKETDELNANNPYGISKISQENFANLYETRNNLKIIKVRAFNHTGPGQNDNFVIPSFCKQIAAIEKSGEGGIINVGNLSAVRDISYVGDIVKCYRLLLENQNSGTYNVGSSNAIKIEDILNKLISFISQDVSIVKDESKFRPIDTPYICADNSKLNETINVEFMSIDNLLKLMLNYYLNN